MNSKVFDVLAKRTRISANLMATAIAVLHSTAQSFGEPVNSLAIMEQRIKLLGLGYHKSGKSTKSSSKPSGAARAKRVARKNNNVKARSSKRS